MAVPLFSDADREAMRLGSSSKWAADLTADDLPALVWMVGEFGGRASDVLAELDDQWSTSPPRDPVAAGRAKLALAGLFRFFAGDRPSRDQYIARWGPVSERAWAAAQGRTPDPADDVGDLWPVAWERQQVGWLKDPRHQLDRRCVGSWVPAVPASGRFAAALAGLPQSPVVVSVGGVRGLIDQPPSQAGELSVFWLV
jgi:hypothetical protein